MNIPFSIVKDLLDPHILFCAEAPPYEGNYGWVENLSCEPEVFDNTVIYVTTYSKLEDYHIPEDCLCICLMEDSKEIKPSPAENIIFLNNKIKIRDVVNILREHMRKIQKWEKAMVECVLQKELHKLIDISGEIIGNTLLAYNDELRLMAYYWRNSKGEQHYRDVIRNNLERRESESEFTDTYFDLSEWLDPEIAKNEGLEETEKRLVARTITVNLKIKLQVFMLCDKGKDSQGKLALFNMLFRQIELLARIEGPIIQQRREDSFLIDLIENKIPNSFDAQSRPEYLNIQLNQFFCLFVVKFKYCSKNTEDARLIKNLSKLLPKAKFLTYDNNILIINYYTKTTNRSESDEWVNAIKDTLRDADAVLGVSMPEDSLRKLHLSYKRAVASIEYGEMVRRKRPFEKMDTVDIYRYEGYDIYSYETFYIYHVIDCLSSDSKTILESSHCMRALAKLYAFDCENKMDNLRLLYCHLTNERSASKTASNTHMHRNNVIYRIKKIEEILGISFDEQNYRFKFLLSYRILDFYGLDYLKNIDYTSVGANTSRRKKPDDPYGKIEMTASEQDQ